MVKNAFYFKVAGAFLVVIAALTWIWVVGTPQYAVYSLMQASKSGDLSKFTHYNVATPPNQDKLMSVTDKNQAQLSYFQKNYYRDQNLWQAFVSSRVQHETIGAGIIYYIPDGSQKIVFRMVRSGNVWQVVDEARINHSVSAP